tara:strand:- start:451 stop:1272 length:822 start_codon:yes stop_codon:yes gene_type:complete
MNRTERRRQQRQQKKQQRPEPQSFEIQYELLRPWSDILFRTFLPPFILERMIKITDDVLNNPKRTPWGQNLAGQIVDEPLIPQEVLEKENVFGFFVNMVLEYIQSCMISQATKQFEGEILGQRDNWRVDLRSMWVVEQQPGEYNPMHLHTDCDISTVMYLKVPEFLPSQKPEKKDDGSIYFVGDCGPSNKLKRGTVKVNPVPGEFYIFPQHLLHTVYPYKTNDNFARRSVSFNASFHHVDPNVNKVMKSEVTNMRPPNEPLNTQNETVLLKGS